MKETKRSFFKLLSSLAGFEIIAYLISCLILLIALWLSLNGTSYPVIFLLVSFAVGGLLIFLHVKEKKDKR